MRTPLTALAVGVLVMACGGDASSDPSGERLPGLPVSERASIAPRVLAPEVERHVTEGNTAFELGDAAGALEHFEAALEADSTEVTAWFGVWMTLAELGETTRAEEARARLTQFGAPRVGDPHAASQSDNPQQGGGA